jgi:hypothetical protein
LDREQSLETGKFFHRDYCGSPPPSHPRTKWTRRVPHPVLIGHVASLGASASVQLAAPSPAARAHHPLSHCCRPRLHRCFGWRLPNATEAEIEPSEPEPADARRAPLPAPVPPPAGVAAQRPCCSCCCCQCGSGCRHAGVSRCVRARDARETRELRTHPLPCDRGLNSTAVRRSGGEPVGFAAEKSAAARQQQVPADAVGCGSPARATPDASLALGSALQPRLEPCNTAPPHVAGRGLSECAGGALAGGGNAQWHGRGSREG